MNVKDNWFTLFSKLTKVLKSKIQNILLPFPTVFYPPETSRFVKDLWFWIIIMYLVNHSGVQLPGATSTPSYPYFPHMPIDTGAH